MAEDEFSDLIDAGYMEVLRQMTPEQAALHVCFGCSATNPIGLHMRFFGKPCEPEVITRCAVGDNYCSFPNHAHGGIIALMLDEMMAYATYHVYQQFGVTKSLSVKYHKPVTANDLHFLRARIVETRNRPNKGMEVIIEVTLHEGTSPDDAICAEATGSYVIMEYEAIARGTR